ncbi:protein PAXX isoform X2 [Manis javanica]|uniref:protein PAXX isoform X2 n=1 Tax=Manis javanica TaxID=9974 RepID=UPI001879DD15|nr:protein PAXX isoform X2 [Manis javanica]
MVPPLCTMPPLCTLPPGPGPPNFVCYCEGEESGDGGRGGFNLYVTDAAELWSTCFTPDSLATLKARFGLSAAEDITVRFRYQAPRQPPGCKPLPWASQSVCAAWSSVWQLWRIQLPAPGRAPGQGGLSSFYQTQILREVAPDLGSGDDVPESPSSTPASRGSHTPSPPSCTRVLALDRCPTLHTAQVTLFSLLARNQLLVLTLMTPEGAKSMTLPRVSEGRDSPWDPTTSTCPSSLWGEANPLLGPLSRKINGFLSRGHS